MKHANTKYRAAFDKVLDTLSTSTLEDIHNQLLKKYNASSRNNNNTTRKWQIEHFIKRAKKEGQREFLYERLRSEEARKVLEILGVSVAETREAKKTLSMKMEELGFPTLLAKMPMSMLTTFCKALMYLEEDTKENVEAGIIEEVFILGATKVLSNIELCTLNSTAKELQVESSENKPDLINNILGLSFPHLINQDGCSYESGNHEDEDRTEEVDTEGAVLQHRHGAARSNRKSAEVEVGLNDHSLPAKRSSSSSTTSSKKHNKYHLDNSLTSSETELFIQKCLDLKLDEFKKDIQSQLVKEKKMNEKLVHENDSLRRELEQLRKENKECNQEIRSLTEKLDTEKQEHKRTRHKLEFMYGKNLDKLSLTQVQNIMQQVVTTQQECLKRVDILLKERN